VTRPKAIFLNGGWGDVEDVAAFLGVSPVTVRKEITRGKLTAFRIGLGSKLLRLKREHVEAYLLSQPVKR
jgi:excisionase family DNA binding protein